VSRNQRGHRGFTLLEVLVAATIMAVAVGTIFSTLSTSLSTASRIDQRDRAAMQAQRILEDLLSDTTLARGPMLSGHIFEAQAGLEADWRAQVTPVDTTPYGWTVDRIALELAWRSGARPQSMHLEGYRTARIAAPAQQLQAPQ
jgi:general secretion pathway protein I